VPSKLITNIWTLGSDTFLCNRILEFLTAHPPGGKGRQQHICHADPQHRAPSEVHA
jgi:hypothetical protein